MANYALPIRSEYFFGALYQRMGDDLHLAGMAQRTVHGYLRSVRQLADYGKRPPDKLTEEQLRRWLLYLKNKKEYAYGSLRVAFSGVKFFYTRTCRRNWQTLAETKLQNIKSFGDQIPLGHHAVLSYIMRCRTGELGDVIYPYKSCQRTHWVGRSCGNRHCPNCQKQKTSR